MTPNIEKKLRNTQWELNVNCGALFDTSLSIIHCFGSQQGIDKTESRQVIGFKYEMYF